MTIAALNQNPPGEKLDGWWVARMTWAAPAW